MMDKRKLFALLPKIDQILSNEFIMSLTEKIPREIIVEATREEIQKLRELIKDDKIDREELELRISKIIDSIKNNVNNKMSMKLKKVINGTGIVIHTNLGRSLISREVMNNVVELATNYSNLEFNLKRGTRGSRYSHVEEILTTLTGAESALVVNNNAAAVLLILSTIAKNKEVVVSRGELVEIGGSFRVPDVMEQSGAKLVGIGTTNKTHLRDYESAIGENTGALLKVHTSNYRILGFTASVSLEEIVSLGNEKNIPVIEDLGSGVLVDLSKYGLQYEPTVQDSIKAGVDIVSFSGDKLLGGPQAGIILGRKKYIDMMKKNPLTRAIRVDKFTLSALEATLRLYLNEREAINKIPTLKMITMPLSEVERKAKTLVTMLKEKLDKKLLIDIVDVFSQVGGGSMPLEEIPSKAVMIYSDTISTSVLERELRHLDTPIIVRINKDRIYMDIRTLVETDFEAIVNGIKYIIDKY